MKRKNRGRRCLEEDGWFDWKFYENMVLAPKDVDQISEEGDEFLLGHSTPEL